MKILFSITSNWADVMDIRGFTLYENSRGRSIEELTEIIQKYLDDYPDSEHFVGTNQSVVNSEITFTLKYITEVDIMVLDNLVGLWTYAGVPDSILESIFDINDDVSILDD